MSQIKQKIKKTENQKVKWFFGLGLMLDGDYVIKNKLPAEVVYTDKDGEHSMSFPISQLSATKEEFLYEVTKVASELYDYSINNHDEETTQNGV